MNQKEMNVDIEKVQDEIVQNEISERWGDCPKTRTI